jgi:integrase/recombinase XerD
MWISDWGTPLSNDRLSAVVTEYVDAADLGRSGGCHIFRHTFATLMPDGAADIRHIRHIQAMLGHENLQTTAGYTRVAIEKLVEVYERTHPRAQRPSASAKAETASTEGT